MAAIKPVTVKKIGSSYGITDGKKWFFYCYRTAERAQAVLDKVNFNDPETRRINIAHEKPLTLVE